VDQGAEAEPPADRRDPRDPLPPTAFIAFRRLNDPELAPLAGVKARIDQRVDALFPTDNLPERLLRALAARRALPVKEVFESFEFFERVRRRLRAPVVADLCCGHGLTGLLFAVFVRQVQEVILLDRRQPRTHQIVYEALLSEAPWIEGRVRYVEATLSRARKQELLPAGCSVVAVHACGKRTDRCLDLALATGGRVAVMPCCYFGTAEAAPRVLAETLGPELASDIDRSYRLERAGYQVQWSAIPEQITPKRRILIGLPAIKSPSRSSNPA
jgi:hypothetical protein